MVVTDHGVTFFNHELIEIAKVDAKDLDKSMDRISCVNRDIALYGSGYLIAAVVQCVPSQCKGSYQGKLNTTSSSWVCQAVAQDQSIQCDEPQDQSILLKRENVRSILEFAPNKFALTLVPTDILIVQNWNRAFLIQDPDTHNHSKRWISPLPGFSEQDFPFLVCAGSASFNLINIKEGFTEVLIAADGDRGSPEAFYMLEHKSSFSMHFATSQSVGGQRIENWHCMRFREDFTETLKNFGRLPISSYQQQLELISTLRKQLEKTKKQKSCTIF